MEKNILLAISDRVAWIKINRPKKLNALNAAVLQELHETFTALKDNDAVRIVVLTGSGDRAFVAGADISEFSDFSEEEALQLVAEGQEKVFDFIAHFPKPTLAAINGFALGGGLELAMACHLRIAADTASLGLPEVSLGLIPGYGGTQRLPELVGKGRALQMILSGEMISAATALEYGLVNAVVPNEELLKTAAQWASKLLKNAPQAQAAAIKAIQEGGNTEGYEIEKQLFAALFNTEGFKEGTDAFLNKRKPNF
jgi:enoyl-CoA hydratase